MAVVATGFLVAQIAQATEIHDFPIWKLAPEYGYGTIRDLDAVGPQTHAIAADLSAGFGVAYMQSGQYSTATMPGSVESLQLAPDGCFILLSYVEKGVRYLSFVAEGGEKWRLASGATASISLDSQAIAAWVSGSSTLEVLSRDGEVINRVVFGGSLSGVILESAEAVVVAIGSAATRYSGSTKVWSTEFPAAISQLRPVDGTFFEARDANGHYHLRRFTGEAVLTLDPAKSQHHFDAVKSGLPADFFANVRAIPGPNGGLSLVDTRRTTGRHLHLSLADGSPLLRLHSNPMPSDGFALSKYGTNGQFIYVKDDQLVFVACPSTIAVGE